MKKKIHNLIQASVLPQYFYEQKPDRLWFLSLLLPALTGFMLMFTSALDKYAAGLISVSRFVTMCFLGVVICIFAVFFRAFVIKIISVFTRCEVSFQDLSYAIGASFGIPLIFAFAGMLCGIIGGAGSASAFIVPATLTQLIPLYYLIIYLNLGGIKKRKIISLISITAFGILQVFVLRMLIGI